MLKKTLADKYNIKTERFGGGASVAKELRVLNKVLRYTAGGLDLEADPCHAEIIIRELNIAGAKPSKVPGSKADITRSDKMPVDAIAAEEERAIHRLAGKIVEMRFVNGEDSSDGTKLMADWELMAVDKENEPEDEDVELERAEARITSRQTGPTCSFSPKRRRGTCRPPGCPA